MSSAILIKIIVRSFDELPAGPRDWKKVERFHARGPFAGPRARFHRVVRRNSPRGGPVDPAPPCATASLPPREV